MKIIKRTTKRKQPKYRKLTIEVEESLAARLDAIAGTRARYRNAGDVAAATVTLYLDLLEELERDVKAFVQAQYRRVRRNKFRIVGK